MVRRGKPKKMPSSERSVLNGIVQDLVKRFASLSTDGKQTSWQEFEEVSSTIERIKELEKNYGKKEESNRVAEWNNFTKWAVERGIKCSNIGLHNGLSPELGLGLQTTCDINENDLIIRVPRNAMLSVENAYRTKIGRLLKENPILKSMPNIALSLYLLFKISEQDLSWTPYFKILPQKYNTVLYFSNDELKLLKGSPVFDQAVKLRQNIARQFAYFYRIFNNDPLLKGIPLREFFTYENYRWAVSTVMTRQNTIPSKDGKSLVNVLIPMWDMCNHLQEKMSTDYNEEKGVCECYAMKKFPRGSQVFICYGKRSNAEFFLHNGFVYPPNEDDSLSIKLGISKSDPLFGKKEELLKKIGVEVSGSYKLLDRGNAMDEDTLKFMRVFLMSKDEIQCNLSRKTKTLRRCEEKELEQVMNFLKTRAMLLLKSYPTTLEEDLEALAEKEERPEHARLVLQLLVTEKKILQSHANSESS